MRKIGNLSVFDYYFAKGERLVPATPFHCSKKRATFVIRLLTREGQGAIVKESGKLATFKLRF